MSSPQPPSRLGDRFGTLYIRPPASWGSRRGSTSFTHFSGRLMLVYGIIAAVAALGVASVVALSPGPGWRAVPVVMICGVVAWIAALYLGSDGEQKLANADLGALAQSAAKAMGTSTPSGAWRVEGPQAEHLAAELRRLNAGLARLEVPPDVPHEQVERDWLAEQVSGEFARYLPSAALTGSEAEPDAVDVDSFTVGEPWPTLESRNREWPTLGAPDESGENPRTL